MPTMQILCSLLSLLIICIVGSSIDTCAKLFGADPAGRVLKSSFTLTHLEDGSFEFTYEHQDGGKQKSTIRPKPRNVGFDYLFVGAEVRIGVSDPVGIVTSTSF